MTVSQTAPDTRAGVLVAQDRAEQDLGVRHDSQTASHVSNRVLAHVGAVRGSQTRRASDFGTPGRNMARRMVAVTVALSEPLDSVPLDWAGTIAANLRLLYSGTTVEVIDTWRADA